MAPRLPADAEALAEADRFEGAPHPRHASRFLGHADAEAELVEACAAERLPHAILIGGPPGVGKATLAWRLARFLLSHEDAAGAAVHARSLKVLAEGPAARQAAALAHPDLFLLRREWVEKTKKLASEIRVEDVRRAIHMFRSNGVGAGYRVAIVDSAEDLNASGANALLKLIEEPPSRSAIVIVAHRPGQVLATIRSRCRKIMLKPLKPADIGEILAGLASPAPLAQREAAAARAKGSMRRALRLLDPQALELDSRLKRMLDDLPRVDWRAAHALAEAVALRDGEADYEALLETAYDWLESKVAERAGGGGPRALAPYAEVWEKVTEAARETDALNLDKRPFVLALFADLAAAARASAA